MVNGKDLNKFIFGAAIAGFAIGILSGGIKLPSTYNNCHKDMERKSLDAVKCISDGIIPLYKNYDGYDCLNAGLIGHVNKRQMALTDSADLLHFCLSEGFIDMEYDDGM